MIKNYLKHMKSISSLYRQLVSERVRWRIYKLFLGKFLKYKRLCRDERRFWWQKKIYFLFHHPQSDIDKAWKIWSSKIVSPYPYKWAKSYEKRFHDIYLDKELDLYYVMHRGRPLYFKRGLSKIFIDILYASLLIEQDKRSAHCYVDSYDDLKGKVLFDVGAAEGIFALDAIDHIKHAYLFECDVDWIEALRATFRFCKDKVQIVQGFISSKNGEGFLTLDSFYDLLENSSQENDIYIKMDIEGAERDALKGATHLLQKESVSGAICIYHLPDDEVVIKSMLEDAGMATHIVPSYIYFSREMRHAIIRFQRNV